jgi:hypothetical protein
VTDPDDIAWMQARMTPHPFACFAQPLVLSSEPDLWKLPQTHIVCTSTLATRDPARLAPAADAGRLWDIDTGHDLMITEPQRGGRSAPPPRLSGRMEPCHSGSWSRSWRRWSSPWP